MADRLMNGIDDGLAEGANLVRVVVGVENPAERLLRRRDIVTLRAQHDNRRADIAQVDGGAVRELQPSGGEVVADEQLVDDELDLLGIQSDMAAPPALETEIALRLGIDLGIEIVLLAPQGIRRIEI